MTSSTNVRTPFMTRRRSGGNRFSLSKIRMTRLGSIGRGVVCSGVFSTSSVADRSGAGSSGSADTDVKFEMVISTPSCRIRKSSAVRSRTTRPSRSRTNTSMFATVTSTSLANVDGSPLGVTGDSWPAASAASTVTIEKTAIRLRLTTPSSPAVRCRPAGWTPGMHVVARLPCTFSHWLDRGRPMWERRFGLRLGTTSAPHRVIAVSALRRYPEGARRNIGRSASGTLQQSRTPTARSDRPDPRAWRSLPAEVRPATRPARSHPSSTSPSSRHPRTSTS